MQADENDHDANAARAVAGPPADSPGSDEDAGDLLGLDEPGPATPRVLARLGLLAFVGAAVSLALSVLVISAIGQSAVLDVVGLILWVGVAMMSIAGTILLATAGILKAVDVGRQARSS